MSDSAVGSTAISNQLDASMGDARKRTLTEHMEHLKRLVTMQIDQFRRALASKVEPLVKRTDMQAVKSEIEPLATKTDLQAWVGEIKPLAAKTDPQAVKWELKTVATQTDFQAGAAASAPLAGKESASRRQDDLRYGLSRLKLDLDDSEDSEDDYDEWFKAQMDRHDENIKYFASTQRYAERKLKEMKARGRAEVAAGRGGGRGTRQRRRAKAGNDSAAGVS
jgi:hypothetical protein